jgi:hypothetical protein
LLAGESGGSYVVPLHVELLVGWLPTL